MKQRNRVSCRRGNALISVLVLVLIGGLIVMGGVVALARDSNLTVLNIEALQSFYAAEAGANMAIRELSVDTDEDGDGTVGRISGDGDPANNPVLGLGAFSVTVSVDGGGTTTVTSTGATESTVRTIVMGYESGGTTVGAPDDGGYVSPKSVENMQIASRFTVSEEVTVTALEALVSGPPPKLVAYAIYADDAGEPGALIVESTPEPVGSVPFTWRRIQIAETTLLPADYWFALAFEHLNMTYRYDESGSMRERNHDAVSDGFLSSWGPSDGSLTRRLSIRGIGGGGPSGEIRIFDWSENGPG